MIAQERERQENMAEGRGERKVCRDGYGKGKVDM